MVDFSMLIFLSAGWFFDVKTQMVEQAAIQAMGNYERKPYRGRVILFRASRNYHQLEPDNGWGRVGIDELNVHDLDCYHGNILFEPTETQVAKIINGYINEN
ncbi:MAG: hypothetical protein JEZ06_22085 [Anaerolineaceae bacterium]|nr:hypothetical protein [Anaerolineaceae bacterium]